jgi:polysaccharide export outer membrane protein
MQRKFWPTFFCLGLGVCFGAMPPSVSAQQQTPPSLPTDMNQRLVDMASASRAAESRLEYRIGPEDLVEISVFEIPELSRTVRVSISGQISLPLVGAVRAAGLTPSQLERELTNLLKNNYVKDPQVSVFLKEFKSDPVSIVGSVKMPGLYPIQTQKSLIEVLVMAQGFSDKAGRYVVVTRKAAEANGEVRSDPKAPVILEIPIKDLLQTGDPKWNVPIYPGDVIKVAPAGTVYVGGSVSHPGAFPLIDFDNVSVIQAVAMAGGTIRAASKKRTVIVRRDAAGNRVEVKIDLARIEDGRDPDATLGANDILFIPASKGAAAAMRGLEATIQAATAMAYRIP